MGQDQLFKEILHSFLKEFLELFFPEVAPRLDFQTLQFPDKELFKGFPGGSRREPDVVAELRTREGNPEVVLVHVEVQTEVRRDVGKRMLEYCALLWLQFDVPVFPVVLYLTGGDRQGISVAEFRHELFGREVVRFRYASIALAQLPAREYVEASPLAAALAALMRRKRASEELELRARMLKRVVTSDLSERRKYLLVNVIETYFALSLEERESFRGLVARKEYRQVQDTELTWGDKLIQQGREEGREQGREEGREQGILQGKRETLKRLLTAKFGAFPKKTEDLIEALSSAEELDNYLDRVLVATSLQDLGLER